MMLEEEEEKQKKNIRHTHTTGRELLVWEQARMSVRVYERAHARAHIFD